VRWAAAALTGILTVTYPVAVYYGLTRWSARGVGLVVLALVLATALLKAWGQSREHLLVVLRMPLAVAALAGFGAWLDDGRFVLAMPVLLNLVFFVGFAGSLRGEVSLVERFARLQEPDLSPAKVAHCRRVTVVWAAFTAANAAVTAALAILAPVKWWALHTGLVAYVLMGLLFATEYVYRKYLFRDYGALPHDRLIARVFPPPPAEP